MTEKISVGLIGVGSMGGALLRGWLEANVLDLAKSAVFDPAIGDTLTAELKKHGVAVNPSPDAARVDILIVAVKPQIASEVLPAFAALAKNAIIVSVMAGKSIASVSRAFSGASRVMRAMPNLPASIGKGASGLYAPETIDAPARAAIERLVAVSGEIVWVETEEAIDFVTAVSGSGPAYFFLMTEALASAGAALGLPEEAAQKLARATAIGAGALLEADPRSAQRLREAVTSPGGTTAAALSVFENERALRRLVADAAEAAANRAREMTV
ncbi:MAG: pyrroline-5-carboxylate reductase [Pseudomonadota bacterium]